MQQPLAQAPQGVCCLTSSSGKVVLRPSIAVGFPSRRFLSCSDSQRRWPSSGTTWFPAQLVEESSSSSVALSCQFSQYCHCAWAIRQLAVEEVIRRGIRQYLHGFSYARSATMTDETLTTVLLLRHERGHTGQSRVTESTCTAGHHTVPGKEIRKSQESSVSPFNSSPLSSFVALNTLSHSRRFSQRSQSCGLTVSARLDLSSTLTLPAVKKLAAATERDSLPSLSSVCNLIDCINLHGRVHDGRCHAGWYPHEQIEHKHVPFLF